MWSTFLSHYWFYSICLCILFKSFSLFSLFWAVVCRNLQCMLNQCVENLTVTENKNSKWRWIFLLCSSHMYLNSFPSICRVKPLLPQGICISFLSENAFTPDSHVFLPVASARFSFISYLLGSFLTRLSKRVSPLLSNAICCSPWT